MILYKYVSFESGSKILSGETIGFTRLNDFNDPFESTAFGFEGREGLDSKAKQTLSLKNNFSNNYGVLSLTKNPLNPLMWSHYSDSHRGMVIGFDVDEAGFNNDGFIIKAKDGVMRYRKTQLRNDYVPTDSDLRNIGNDKEFSLTSPNKNIFKRAFLEKQKCWKYEDEVRIVKNLKASDLLRQFKKDEIRKNNYIGQSWSYVLNGYNPLYLYHFPITAIKEVYIGKNTQKFLEQEYNFLENNREKRCELYCSHLCDKNFQTHIENTNCEYCQKLYKCPPLAYRSKFSDLNYFCGQISLKLQIVSIDYSTWKLQVRSYSY